MIDFIFIIFERIIVNQSNLHSFEIQYDIGRVYPTTTEPVYV